jgi:hypothetical protein
MLQAEHASREWPETENAGKCRKMPEFAGMSIAAYMLDCTLCANPLFRNAPRSRLTTHSSRDEIYRMITE